MPKNKKEDTSESLKEKGNKAFLERDYENAIQFYTKAIELSTDNPNAVYFANRANVLLEQNKFDECILDCNQALQLDPKYVKAYFRKAKALFGLTNFEKAKQVCQAGLAIDDTCKDIKDMIIELDQEIEGTSHP